MLPFLLLCLFSSLVFSLPAQNRDALIRHPEAAGELFFPPRPNIYALLRQTEPEGEAGGEPGGEPDGEPGGESHDDTGGESHDDTGGESHDDTGEGSHGNTGQHGGGQPHHKLGICLESHSHCRLQLPVDCNEVPCISKFTIIIFPLLSLFIGVLSVPTSRLVRVPYTLFLLIVGIVMGLLGCGADLGLLSVSLRQWVHLNPPTTFFYVFLAPLIFEASFNTRWHVFKRLLLPILTAAFVIVILQAGLIAVFQKVIVGYDDWSWWAALMFGSMLSATDPISVTATLKALGASEFLNTLIEGESLVNDGSAFVLWEAFIENVVDPEALSIGQIILRIFRLSVGGMLMGVLFGIVSLVILGLVYDEFEVETSLTIIVAFLGFWTAQAPSKLSGVICNVSSGLVISAFGRHLITPAVRGPLAEFWELLSWIANTIVFVHAGLMLSAFSWSCAGDPNTYVDYLLILGYYLFLQVMRMSLILMFKPFMAIGNKWFQWKEALVVGFSGLRGAISLVLALEVAGAPGIASTVQSRIVLWTTGVVALSLLVNGFLIKPLIQGLRLDKAKKSREDFLHRARAIMTQRSLMILDSLCIETGFKSARWSYVVKNVLPSEWLEDSEHGQGYREGLAQLMDNNAASTRKSLEFVKNEERQKLIHTEFTRRLSTGQDIRNIAGTPDYNTPRHSTYGQVFTGRPYSPLVSANILGSPGLSRSSISHRVPASAVSPTHSRQAPSRVTSGLGQNIVPLSLGVAAVQGGAYSLEGPNRRSIDVDVARYQSRDETREEKLSQAKIHQEVAALHQQALDGQSFDFTEIDREVQRRLLTAILSHVRAISNASLVEYNVLLNLEQDIQLALDANDEGKNYDLFSFLDNRGRQTNKNVFYKSYVRFIEGKALKGQTSITTAFVVFGILTEILKEEILHASPVVLLQAEQLYEGAAALLNRLEALNPLAFEWVESQFAVYVSAKKQDEVLDDMLESGVVDQQEYGVIHEELIEVRRDHVRSRHSVFHRRKNHLTPHPAPRALLREHPFFSSLPANLMNNIVSRHGELTHLKGGQSVKAEKGSLVLVLEGAIRPMEDSVLPEQVATSIRKSTTEMQMATVNHQHGGSPTHFPKGSGNQNSSSGSMHDDGTERRPGFTPLESGATMHWCFPAHNGFCGPSVTLHSHNRHRGERCAIADERAIDTQFCCCEIAGRATVFTLPVAQVQMLARESEGFRMEITRSLAREIVLESVADQRPYNLSHFVDSLSSYGVDVNTVVGRAFRVLVRLPYMSVLALEAGEMSAAHVQGPGVLLNGTVRVSIVDTSGLIGAINLLHEELTGPALLPAGGLILQEVHKPDDPDELQEGYEAGECPLKSENAIEASETAAELLGLSEGRSPSGQHHSERRVLAHVLIEEISETNVTATRRLRRWTGRELSIDMNGRFGMYRHVEMHAFQEAKVE